MIKNLFTFIIVFFSEISTFNVEAKDYYVSNSGSDANFGTLNEPFLTIQKAATAMMSGDKCYVREGTYRETVTVNQDNLSFEAYNNEYVLITGADLVTGWTLYKDDIYQASFTGIQTQFTQLFYKGKMQQIARYPDNTSGNMLSIEDNAGYASLEVKSGAITFTNMLPGGNDFWKDGYVRAISGLTWINATGKVTASSANNLSCEMLSTDWKNGVANILGAGKGYILHLNALSREGEWYHQNNTVYFWKPGGGSPTNTEVEAQKREFAFVANGKNGLGLKGLHIKSASLNIIGNNSNIEKCTFRDQIGWFWRKGYGPSFVQMGGAYISGTGNNFRECYFAGGWGTLLNFENGSDNTVTNSIFENNGWMSMFTSCIFANSPGLIVKDCTFGSTGRFHIRTTTNIKILNNEFYDCMKMCQDAGSITITNGGDESNPLDLKGAEIAYNKFHDMNTLKSFFSPKNFVVALYLEGSYNYTAHHNLVYNIRTQNKQGRFYYGGPRTSHIQNINFYNNTVWNVDEIMGFWNKDAGGLITNMKFVNNIFDARATIDYGTPSLGAGISLQNNFMAQNNSIFTNTATNDFSLLSSSAAIDYGKEIPIITDGFTGVSPDAGCFELNKPKWTCGATMQIPEFKEMSYTGISETYEDDKSIQIFPNPVIDVMNVKCIGDINQIIIYNILGETICRKSESTVNLSDLKSGVYIVGVETDLKVRIKKIVKI